MRYLCESELRFVSGGDGEPRQGGTLPDGCSPSDLLGAVGGGALTGAITGIVVTAPTLLGSILGAAAGAVLGGALGAVGSAVNCATHVAMDGAGGEAEKDATTSDH